MTNNRRLHPYKTIYPGYQRFFSRAAGIFGVGRRPTHLRPWAEVTTEIGNRASKVSGTQGTNHMYFETDFKVFKMNFQYLNTIFLYYNPNSNFCHCLKYILSVVKLYFIKRKASLINLQCSLFNKYD